MPSVVIIHAAEDTLPARALAEKLRQAQLQVILEKPPGEDLRAAVKSAPVTIALWSPRSNANPELADEVNFARGKSKVFHALMQSAQAPEQFRNDKSVNLTGWRGEDEFAPWRELAKLVTDKAGVPPLPPPAPKPPSGFFQPGRPGTAPPQAAQSAGRQQQQRSQQQSRPAPQPRAPKPPPERTIPDRTGEPKQGGGMIVIAAIVFVVVAVLGGGGYWYFTQNNATATSAAWDAVNREDADELRSFLAGDPGQYREEAQQALADLEESSFQRASNADTIEAFEAFLNDFPDSDHATRARGRIAELRTMQPATTEEAVPLEPLPEVDPDLLPPGTTTTPAPTPDTGGPTTITPPPAEAPGEPEGPTN